MYMIKGIFFDVDGTIFSHKTHTISSAIKEAIKDLQSKDIKVFLATGRSYNELETMGVLDMPYDGYALMNGQLVLNHDFDAIYENPIEKHDNEVLVKAFEDKLFPIIIIEKKDIYINYVDEHVINIENSISSKPPRIDHYSGNKVYQFMAYTKNIKAVYSLDLPNSKLINWFDEAFDIINANGDKTMGIKALCDYYDISLDETMAFGDGENDATMLEYAGIGVAMGNGHPKTKAIADYVTDGIDDDGVISALKYFKLIGE